MMILRQCVDMGVVSPEKEGRRRLVVPGDNGVARLLYLVALSLLKNGTEDAASLDGGVGVAERGMLGDDDLATMR